MSIYYAFLPSGQVAQLVERGPEKAGVGGSIPSLATNTFNNLAPAKKRVKISRAYNTRTFLYSHFTFGVARSNDFQLSHLRLALGNVMPHVVVHSLRTVDLCCRN